jgi:hypothetical protein
VPWSAEAHWAAGDDVFYLGLGNLPEVQVRNEAGTLVGVIRWHQEPRELTSDDRTLYGQLREQWIPSVPPLREVLPPLSDYPDLPTTKPFSATLLVDDRDRLWVREYPDHIAGRPDIFDHGGPVWLGGEASEDERWRVFDVRGQLLGVVAIPSRVSVLAVAQGHVVGVVKDSLDAEHVVLHRIVGNGE